MSENVLVRKYQKDIFFPTDQDFSSGLVNYQ